MSQRLKFVEQHKDTLLRGMDTTIEPVTVTRSDFQEGVMSLEEMPFRDPYTEGFYRGYTACLTQVAKRLKK